MLGYDRTVQDSWHGPQTDLRPVRCAFCNSMLFRGAVEKVEIKCSRCGAVQVLQNNGDGWIKDAAKPVWKAWLRPAAYGDRQCGAACGDSAAPAAGRYLEFVQSGAVCCNRRQAGRHGNLRRSASRAERRNETYSHSRPAVRPRFGTHYRGETGFGHRHGFSGAPVAGGRPGKEGYPGDAADVCPLFGCPGSLALLRGS